MAEQLTFNLLARLHVDAAILEGGDHEKIVESLLHTSHIRLAGLGLTALDNLECLGRVTHVYLQRNALTTLDGLECLVDLRVLDVSHNRLTSMTTVPRLPRLQLLNLSHNAIVSLDHNLPESLAFLSLLGNPVMESAESRFISCRAL